jgi:hypothetical protein
MMTTLVQTCNVKFEVFTAVMWRRVDIVLTDFSEERRLTKYLHSATSQNSHSSCSVKL